MTFINPNPNPFEEAWENFIQEDKAEEIVTKELNRQQEVEAIDYYEEGLKILKQFEDKYI